MPNPLVTANSTPYFNLNYSAYQPGVIYPNNMDVVVWAPGTGYDTAVAGTGRLMHLTAAQMDGVNNGNYYNLDLLALWCPSPLVLPYKTARKLYVSWSDNSWEPATGSVVIVGINEAGVEVSETIYAPAAPNFGELTTHMYQSVTSIVSFTSGSTLTADFYLDLGYTGQTLPFMPDGKCSSWSVSLQVSVANTISYNVMCDNAPRNVQTNTMPSQASPWYADLGAAYPFNFPMLDYTVIPAAGDPYPSLTGVTASILTPVPFPVGNVYIEVTDTTTTDGSFVAILLQDSVWFK